jgi:hypothetical protein
MEVLYAVCCGLDVHKASVTACLRSPGAGAPRRQEVRTFIPDYNREQMRTDAFRFADTVLSSKVRHGLHAMAIDEQRADLTPTLWDGDPRIVQVLFPGSHSDVGGGYPRKDRESGLSDGACSWMTAALEDLGVRFSASLPYTPDPDPCGMMHRPWLQVPWTLLPAAQRVFPPGLALHRSVVDRLAGGRVPLQFGGGRAVRAGESRRIRSRGPGRVWRSGRLRRQGDPSAPDRRTTGGSDDPPTMTSPSDGCPLPGTTDQVLSPVDVNCSRGPPVAIAPSAVPGGRDRSRGGNLGDRRICDRPASGL